jgi:hypothetical protein
VTVISPNVVLIDRYNREWRCAPSYQDHTPDARGWLLLRTTAGEEMPFSEVVDRYGMEASDGVRLLNIRLDDTAREES